ncbi:hypothetical protein CEXT_602931 [Caerostris extrusa]|uniref:Uncharacterized protein n=1 Tax=Caerostris extrusa TaxID=172846 RepID=A0AAV4U6B7_CAEEX|nr:hypothetical protein CEXT_602931 [Caerostris extrusa]
MRQMDARGNGKFIWNYFLAFQSGLQTRKERSTKQRVPIRIKRCATSGPHLPLSLTLCTDSIWGLSGQEGLRACNCGLENDASKVFFLVGG